MLRSVWILGIYFLLNAVLHAQQVELSLSSVGKEKGLSNSTATCITQDSLGYIWIGTQEGLNRYDGFNFKVFESDEDIPTSLPDNSINVLHTDANGRVWIGTDGGICYYEPEWNQFVQISISVSSGDGNEKVGYIGESSRYGVLFSVANILYKIDYESKIAHELLSIPQGEITSFLFDEQENLWIGAFKGGGLYKYDHNTNLLEHYLSKKDDQSTLSSNSIFSISIRDGREIWIATEDEGVNLLNLESGKIKRYPYDTYYDKFALYTFVDRQNNVWFGHQTGLKIYVDEEDDFYYYYTDPNDIKSIRPNARKIFQDIQNNYWVLYYQGGAAVSVQQKGFQVFTDQQHETWHTSNKSISALEEDREGNLWIANPYNGIDIFYWIQNKTLRFYHDNKDPSSLGSGAVFALSYDENTNRMWIGTNRGGLQYTDNKEGRFVSFLHNPDDPNSIAGNDVRSIFVDHKGRIWLAVHGKGIDMLDPETQVFHHYTREKNQLCNDWTYEVMEDHLGSIWVATAYGLSRLPEGKETFVNYIDDGQGSVLTNNEITTVFQDSLYRVWVGTSKGLNQYNRGKDIMEPVEGILKDEYICSILDDNEGALWIGTLNGLFHYFPSSGKVYRLDEVDGIPSNEFSPRAAYKNLFNKLFFGSHSGLVLFNPNDLNYNTTKPRVVLSGFRLFNREVTEFGPDKPLDKHIAYANELQLEHDQNMITFEFIALNMINPHKNQYAYMLEGFDDDWHYIGDRREATYTNLDPGKYVFRVRASNNDGVWNNTGASINIIVHPPWWRTVWFRALVVLIVSILLLGLYFYRTNTLKRQKKVLEKKVKKSTLELQDKNKQLTEKSSHLNEVNALLEERQQEILEKSIKLQELNTSKDRMFSIIAHDLTSPFNAIMGFSELLFEKFEQIDDSEKRELSKHINDSSKRVYSLLENLLNWARTQTNRIKYDPTVLDLEGILKEAIDIYQFRINKKNIHVELENKTERKPYADKDMIKSVVRNLISNATKYTPHKGKINIRIEQDQNEIRTSVIDSGIGISKDIYNNLFNLDKSSSIEGTEGEKGSGIGLILINEFIGLNGGTLTIRSKEGKGSTFSFTLPMADK